MTKDNFIDEVLKITATENAENLLGIRYHLENLYNQMKSEAVTTTKKTTLTANGVKILKVLQEHETVEMSAADVGDYIDLSSRSVSGSMRKLVTEGYVDKIAQDSGSALYKITDKGLKIKEN